MGSPCGAKKCIVHRICAIALSIATNSASVEPLVLSFCWHEEVYAPPFPMLINMPLWLFISGCTTYELATHHCELSFGLIVRVIVHVSLRYCITLVNFLQLSSSGSFTLVHENAMAFFLFCHVLLHRYSNFAKMWWNSCALSSDSFFAPSFSLNWGLAPGVFVMPCMS